MTRPILLPTDGQLEFTFDSYVEELEVLDAALGAHLLYTALTPGAAATTGRRGSPAWWRTQVIAWCGLASTAARFDPEAVGSAAMAAQHMEEYLLMPWIRSLLAAGAAVHMPDRPAA